MRTCTSLLVGLFLVAGCSKTPVAAPPPPPKVVVAKPVVRDVKNYHDVVGNTKAIETVEVRARVKGYLKSVEMVDAADVKAGDLLFVIEPDLYQADLEAAEAKLAQAKATHQDKVWELERLEKLRKENNAAQREYQEGVTAEAEAAAQIRSAEAEVHQAQLNVDYTKVKSPIDGMLSEKYVDVGNLVGASENTLLTRVIKMHPMYVYFEVPERILVTHLREMSESGRLRGEGDNRFFAQLEGEEGYPHEGELDFIDNQVDAATGTVMVRGIVPNEDRRLYSGLFCRVRIPVETISNAVLVEEQAIGTDLSGKYVLTVDNKNIVNYNSVRLGPKTDDGYVVILEGLKGDDQYIVSGLMSARPGLPVTPAAKETTATPSTPGTQDAETSTNG